MAEILFPPDILPQEESTELVDDGTSVFQPVFGTAQVQRAQYMEPHLEVTQTYRALRLEDKARVMSVLGRLKGSYNTLRIRTGFLNRGSASFSELFTDPTFANGASNWSAESSITGSVTDRVYRALRNATGAGNAVAPYQSIALTSYLPYVVKSAAIFGRGISSCSLYKLSSSADGVGESLGNQLSSTGFMTATIVPTATGNYFVGVYQGGNSNSNAGDFIDVPLMSARRSFLVDNGSNLLTYSDQLDNAAWTKTRSTVSANSIAAPDGTSTADSLIEDTSNNTHIVTQNATVSASAADYCFSVALKAGTRSWAQVVLTENTGSTSAYVFINLSDGSSGTSANGTNFTNRRAFVRSLGNGWYYIALIARKTNSATSITARVSIATGDLSQSYLGDGSSNIYMWRATLAQSSVPVRLAQTTSSSSAGSSQTGNSLYVKGGQTSTTGALRAGDIVEINGEAVMLTSDVSFDSAQLGYMTFAPAIFRSPADNDPISAGDPFGKYMLLGNPQWTNRYGQYADLTLKFRAIYE